jgi:hypothetical protein
VATPLRECWRAVRMDLISACSVERVFNAPQPSKPCFCQTVQKAMSGWRSFLDLGHVHFQLVKKHTYHLDVLATTLLLRDGLDRLFLFAKKNQIINFFLKNNNVGRLLFSIVNYLCGPLLLVWRATFTGRDLFCLFELAR